MAVMLPGTVFGVNWITFRKKDAELVHRSLVWAAWNHHQLFKKQSGQYMYRLNLTSTERVHVSFHSQNRIDGLSNRGALCLLGGRNWNFKCCM